MEGVDAPPLEDLRDSFNALTSKQFDQLILFLLEDIENNASISFVPDTEVEEIDLRVETAHPIFPLEYGIAIEHVKTDEAVSRSRVEGVAETIQNAGFHSGAVITSGEFSDSASDVADNGILALLGGNQLTELLLEYELGFQKVGESISLDEDFWELFRGQSRSDRIPSIEIPQADSIDRLEQTLTAIAAGNNHKADIAAMVEEISSDTFDPRQADYYGTAGWLLDFLHKDRHKGTTSGRGRWGLTRLGKTYLSLRDEARHQAADELLHSQIRDMEIIRRILNSLEEKGFMTRKEVVELVEEETELGGTTVPRRTRSLVKWLGHLPEIDLSGSGSTQEIRYLTEVDTDVPEKPPLEWHESNLPPTVDESEVDGRQDPPDENKILDEMISEFESI